jgi:integral membrane sensor domain MASE1
MLQPRRLPGIPLMALAALCLACAELGLLVIEPMSPAALPALWPPTGVLVAALIASERRRWAVIVPLGCGVMLLSLTAFHGRPVLASAGFAVASGLDAVLAAWVVRRSVRDTVALDRLPHMAALVAAASLAPMVGGLLAANVLQAGLSSTPGVWIAWWLAETIGILVASPLLLALFADDGPRLAALRSWKTLETAVAFSAGALLTQAIFSGTIDPMLRVPAYILPFLLWSVLRFGPGGAAAAAFLVCFLVLENASQGRGPLGLLNRTTADVLSQTSADLVLRSQGAVATAAAAILLLASVVAERKRTAKERDRLLAELKQAMAEIKTLRGFVPICAWCHKVRDDHGSWHRLEVYLDARTDAVFSHSICPSCTEQERRVIDAVGAD